MYHVDHHKQQQQQQNGQAKQHTTMTANSMRSFCQPRNKGQTYLAIGQDLFSVYDYLQVQYNYSLHSYWDMLNSSSNSKGQQQEKKKTKKPMPPVLGDSLPTAMMVYTDIQTLRGLDLPTDYGSGVEYANGLAALYGADHAGHADNAGDSGSGALQIGLWLNGTTGCRDIVSRRLDANIQNLIHYLVTCPFDQVFLRVGYEFDNPSFGYHANRDDDDDDGPDMFQQAFRYIVQACRDHDEHLRKHLKRLQTHHHHHDGQQQRGSDPVSSSFCMTKTVFVWHSWAASLTTSDQLARYYPGNDYVDWIGISLFSQLYKDNNTIPPNVSKLGSRETVQAVLDFAKHMEKPIMIAESTPFGGIDKMHDPWHDWFVPVLQLIQNNDIIGMWSYIHCDWDSQPMWHGVGFGDSRLGINATVLQYWQEDVLQNERFLQHADGGSLSRFCNTNRRRRGDDDDAGDDVVPSSSTSTSLNIIAMTLDAETTTTALPFTTTDDEETTWHAPAPASRRDIELAWVAGIGLGVLVMILGSCRYCWRMSSSRSSTASSSNEKGNDDVDDYDVNYDERHALFVEPSQIGYGSPNSFVE
jgi:hypothetical protein